MEDERRYAGIVRENVLILPAKESDSWYFFDDSKAYKQTFSLPKAGNKQNLPTDVGFNRLTLSSHKSIILIYSPTETATMTAMDEPDVEPFPGKTRTMTPNESLDQDARTLITNRLRLKISTVAETLFKSSERNPARATKASAALDVCSEIPALQSAVAEQQLLLKKTVMDAPTKADTLPAKK